MFKIINNKTMTALEALQTYSGTKDSDAVLVSELKAKGYTFEKQGDFIMCVSADTQMMYLGTELPTATKKVKVINRISKRGSKYYALALA